MGYRKVFIYTVSALLSGCLAEGPQVPPANAATIATSPDLAHYQLEATFGSESAMDAVVRTTLPVEVANADPSFILGERFSVEIESSVPADITIEDYDKPVDNTQLIKVNVLEAVTEPVELVFRYQGPLNQDREDAYTARSAEQLELRLDMMWFPIYRDLNLRFSLDATFRGVPADFVPVSQGNIVQEGETVRVQRELPDIDIPFVATRGLTRFTAPGVEVYAADFDWVVTDILRRHAISSVTFLQEWFGPLPDGDVRLVILPNASGAYARRGYIVTGEARDEVEKAGLTEVPEFSAARLVAHEFAHAWWASGDPLTENRWLSESIAEFSSIRYVESAFGLARANEFLERKREPALGAPPVLGTGEVHRNTIYHRGPHLLFDLEQEIGRSLLDEVLARLARNPPRATEGFMSVLGEVAGKDAVTYFDTTMHSGPGPWREDEEDKEEQAAAGEEEDAG
jgi:hypothetical protein